MTTTGHRPGGAHGAALRWARAAVIALVSALAILFHLDTTTATAIAHAPAAVASETGGMAGVHRSAGPAAPARESGRAMPSGVTAPAPAHDGMGACCCTVTQDCCVAKVDSLTFTPPHQPFTGCVLTVPPGVVAGRDAPGTTGRAPPDLSVLSRLLL